MKPVEPSWVSSGWTMLWSFWAASNLVSMCWFHERISKVFVQFAMIYSDRFCLAWHTFSIKGLVSPYTWEKQSFDYDWWLAKDVAKISKSKRDCSWQLESHFLDLSGRRSLVFLHSIFHGFCMFWFHIHGTLFVALPCSFYAQVVATIAAMEASRNTGNSFLSQITKCRRM